MTIQQIIDEQMKEFDEKFQGDVTTVEYDGTHARFTSSLYTSLYNRDNLKSFISSYTRTLIEAVGEEIIGYKYKINPRMRNRNFYLWKMGYNSSVDDSRLKLKEIIKSLK